MRNESCGTADEGACAVLAVHGLSEAQADWLMIGLQVCAKSWSVERIRSYDGHLVLLIAFPSDDWMLVIDRTVNEFHIDRMEGDLLHPECCYRTVGDVMAAIMAMSDPDNTFPQPRAA